MLKITLIAFFVGFNIYFSNKIKAHKLGTRKLFYFLFLNLLLLFVSMVVAFAFTKRFESCFYLSHGVLFLAAISSSSIFQQPFHKKKNSNANAVYMSNGLMENGLIKSFRLLFVPVVVSALQILYIYEQ